MTSKRKNKTKKPTTKANIKVINMQSHSENAKEKELLIEREKINAAQTNKTTAKITNDGRNRNSETKKVSSPKKRSQKIRKALSLSNIKKIPRKIGQTFKKLHKATIKNLQYLTQSFIAFFAFFSRIIQTLSKVLGKTLSYIFIFSFLVSLGVVIVAYPLYLDYQSSLPPLSLRKITNRTKPNSIVYDKDDNPVTSLAEEAFISVNFEDLPQSFIDAITATEDSRFFNHNGIDGPRTIEAVVINILRDDITSGGSTITQQLIKMTSLQDRILDSETGAEYKNSNRRKAHEMILAYQLEKQLSKEEILTAYANSLGYGRFVGVGTAAKRYFNKSVSELTLPEAALLAGIPQSSSSNDPYRFMEEGTERYQTVVDLMLRHEYITKEEQAAIKYIPLSNILLTNQRDFINKNKAYFDSIEAELNNLFNVTVDISAGESFPYYYTGLKIFSALDVEQQNHANMIMNTEEVVPYSTMLNNLWGSARNEDENLQAAFAVVNVKNGEIPAIGASRNYDGYNMALHGYRSPGSSIKPLIDYAPGMEKYGWSPTKTFLDGRTYYSGSFNEIYNFSNSVSNRSVTINTAIAQSLNTVAVRAIQEVGVEYAGQFVNNIGIKRAGALLANNELYESAALGGGLEVTPVEMAGAYASFGNAGQYNPPHFIRRIENEYGEIIYEYKDEAVQMMQPKTARDMTTALEYSRWNGTPAGGGRRQVKRSINFAAKTGTSSYGTDERYAYGLSSSAEKDHWIVGYSPEYSIAVWTGFNIEDAAFLRKTGGNVNANKQYGSYILTDWINTFAPEKTDFSFNVEPHNYISISGLAVNLDDANRVVTWNKPTVSYPLALSEEERRNFGNLVFDVYIINNGQPTKIIDASPDVIKIPYEAYLTAADNEIKIVARMENNVDIARPSERQLKLR